MKNSCETQKDEPFSELIKDSYGSPSRLASLLDIGIEMLFYIEEDVFEKRDVQSVVSAIRGIINVLRQRE